MRCEGAVWRGESTGNCACTVLLYVLDVLIPLQYTENGRFVVKYMYPFDLSIHYIVVLFRKMNRATNSLVSFSVVPVHGNGGLKCVTDSVLYHSQLLHLIYTSRLYDALRLSGFISGQPYLPLNAVHVCSFSTRHGTHLKDRNRESPKTRPMTLE